jgi:hypothetical protein
MRVTNIAVPEKLDQNVNKWNEDDVQMFFMANMEEYGLRETDIQAVKIQRLCGIVLLNLDAAAFLSFAVFGGPAMCIGVLVNDLKVAKGLVPGK